MGQREYTDKYFNNDQIESEPHDKPTLTIYPANKDFLSNNSNPIYRYGTTRDIIYSNHHIDEHVPYEQAVNLDPIIEKMMEKEGFTDVEFDRLEVRGTVNTVQGKELRYRVKTLVFEPGGKLIVHASIGFTLIVDDLFIQDKNNPGKIEIVQPATPKKQPIGATGTQGPDAPDHTYRGGDGGMGKFGVQGKQGEAGNYLYLIVKRCDHAYPLEIITLGGNGGAGSDGGAGGRGGDGHKGRNGSGNWVDCKKGCTDGTSGGHGGKGGYPHFGGNGGTGGTVWIQGPKDFLDKARFFRINNQGGKGGARGIPGRGGNGGTPGAAGDSPGVCKICYKGRYGIAGPSGEIADAKDGNDGPRGTIRHIEE